MTDVESCAIPLDKHDFLINIFEILFSFRMALIVFNLRIAVGEDYLLATERQY